MSRRRKRGINKLFQMLLAGELTEADILASLNLTEIHHLKSRGQGGSNKKSNKYEVSALLHRIWHLLVGDSEPEEAARLLSIWISRNSRFFAISKGEPIYKTAQEMNQWLEGSGVKIEIVFEQSKIIQFRPLKDSLSLPRIVS